jgi:hypothetical protein
MILVKGMGIKKHSHYVTVEMDDNYINLITIVSEVL